jgi:hypothetical protein
MQKVLIAAALVAHLAVPAQAGDFEEWGRHSVGPAAGEIPLPRPGAAVRDTVGAAPAPVPAASRVIDDRVIVEERAPSASLPRCSPGSARPECAR